MTAEPTQLDSYHELPREEVIPFLPAGVASVIDVGCGRGGFGPTLRQRYPDAHIVGVEAVESQAAIAATDHEFDEVLAGYFPQVLAGRSEKFDLVTFNDVLEHIVDPWSAVESVHNHLTPGGRIVAAIPNVQFVWNLTDLLAGRWDYQDWGILDRTHVRFFTKSTAASLFAEHGYEVESCVGVNPAGGSGKIAQRAVRWGLMHAIPDSRWMHFVVVARSIRA